MDTIVCDIARSRMERDFNAALDYLGLFVTSIQFEGENGLCVVVEFSVNEDVLSFEVV